ncbi:hypothetical protein PV682_41390 [Streptomyces niveiscabiei]|uniref:hypothetical protein n=1 Tax=Streptomyces niveiscabiei TaxID=164115 RepID=UPI0029B83DF8|nr:hypothetical protein [Streptomyces niveiscabiei]MDX3387853.1 hypothetical protein [Streptomyces niveiscabiei]
MCGLELADAALTAPTGRDALVPLWVTAPRLAASGHSLESAIAEAAGLDALPPLPPGARWLVLIDALDEVHHDHRSRLIHRLADRARQGGASGGPCLLLTTRPDPDVAPQLAEAGFRRYVLDPFDRRRLEEFAHGWFEDSGHGERAAGFLEQVDEAGLGELLGVPLLATAAAIVHEDRPEAPLPDNSWDLYDRFRLHLRAVKRDQARRLWADLEERAAPTPDGTWAVTHLRERADELLGEVAYAQVAEGETDLPGVAARWWAGFADPPLDGWNAVLTEALLTTGLFVRRRQGLEFLHTTFAEHCAAQRLARRLPARFDPADPLWRTTLLAASGITGHPLAALHRKALLHHARRAPGGALLDWLQGGSFDGHRLAAELMAERYPADDAHHRRFLAALRERGGDADELLLRLRHSLVTEHLRELLRSGTPAERLLAARGLARSDGETVARELPGIAGSHGVGLSDVYGVAQFLEEEWPRQTAEALAAVLRRPGGMPWDRIGGAARLEDEELRAELLRAELHGLKSGPDAFTRITAARTLAELGEPYEGEAVEWLVWTALDPLSDPLGTTAMALVDTLSTLGAGHHREAAVQVLRGYVVRGTGSPLSASYLRGRAASRLLRAGEPYAAEAVTLMREHASDREYRSWAAQELNGREPGGGPARGSVEEALDSAIRSAEAWWRGEPVVEDTPYEVRETLAAYGAAAVPVLMDSLCAPGSMGGYESFSPDVMAALGELHEAFPEETAGELRARFAYGGPGDDLYDYGSRYPGLRQAVLGALLALGVLQPPGDSPLLLRLAEEGWSWEHRTAATDALRGAAPDHKRDLADELCRTLTRLDRSYVRDVAETLVRIGGGQARRVGTTLRTRAQNPDPAVRRSALQGLLALGGEWVPTDAAPLAELAACRQASPAERLRAIRASALLEGRLPRRTAGALYDVVEATGDVGAYFSLAPLVSRGPFPAGLPVRRARRMLRRNAVRMHLFWPGLLPRISRDVPAAELARAVRARIRGVVPGGKRRRLDLAKLLIALGDERSAAVAARVLRRLLVGERSWSIKRREIAELLVLSDDSHARRLPTRIGRGPLFWRTPVRDWGEDTLIAIASGGGQWARWAADTLCAMVVENPGRYGVERHLSVLVGLRWTFRPQVLTALRAVAATDSPTAPRAAEALALLAARD